MALIAGFVDAIAGGGGVITFPAFLWLGLPVSQIVGTNKLVSTAGTSVAALTYLRRGLVQPEVVGAAWPFTFSGALIGAASVLILPNGFLKPLVSVLVITVALACFFRPALGIHHGFEALTTRSRRLTQAVALLLGFYDGFFGPGTGIFLTFFCVRVLQCDYLRATANTKVLNGLSNAVPLVVFLFHGSIRFELGIPMLIANTIGGVLGAHTAIAKGSHFIRWIYLLMALLTAGKLVSDLLLTL